PTINFADISPASLTITAGTNTRTYDATTSAAATPGVAGLKGSDTVTQRIEEYTASSAGSGLTLNVTGYTINDGNGGDNYTVTTLTDTTGAITPRPLTVTAAAANKVYDGSTTATVTLSDNHLGSDGVTATYGGAVFADKNVGTGKPVTVTGIAI